jgi:hypothetical protein
MIKRSQSAGRAQIDRFCTDRRRLMPSTNWRHIGGDARGDGILG